MVGVGWGWVGKKVVQESLGRSAEVAEVGEALLDEGLVLGGVAGVGQVRGRRGGVGVVEAREAVGVEGFGEDAAVEVGRWGEAEDAEGGGGDVEQRGVGGERGAGSDGRTGGDEDAFDAVIAGGSESGGDGFIGGEVVESDGAVAPVGQDDGEVGGEVGVGSVVEVVAFVDVGDQGFAGLGVGELEEAGFEVVEDGAGVGGVEAAVGLAALEVEEDLAEVALGVGGGPRPVDMFT